MYIYRVRFSGCYTLWVLLENGILYGKGGGSEMGCGGTLLFVVSLYICNAATL